MTRPYQWAALASALVALSASSALAGTPTYSVLDLGTLGGVNSLVNGLNTSGQATGQADSSASSLAYLTSPNSALTSADALPTPSGNTSVGKGLNDSGTVVGYVNNGSGAIANVWTGASSFSLGTLGGAHSTAFGINNSGTIVGGADTATGSEAFVTQGTGALSSSANGIANQFGGNEGAAYAVNSGGTVVGEAQNSSGNDQAFMYTSTVTGSKMTSLAGLTASSSDAYAINTLGEIVGGAAITSGSYQAFLDNGGTVTSLGALAGNTQSIAYGINNSGVIVGESDLTALSGAAGATAFVDYGSGLQNLNTLVAPGQSLNGFKLATAQGINSSGQIIVNGYNAAGNERSFLLTPNSATAVPEPGNIALLLLGAPLLLWVTARRRTAKGV